MYASSAEKVNIWTFDSNICAKIFQIILKYIKNTQTSQYQDDKGRNISKKWRTIDFIIM